MTEQNLGLIMGPNILHKEVSKWLHCMITLHLVRGGGRWRLEEERKKERRVEGDRKREERRERCVERGGTYEYKAIKSVGRAAQSSSVCTSPHVVSGDSVGNGTL